MTSANSLENGVDLFSGSLCFTLPVATLSGGPGPAVDVVASYGSNVEDVVRQWNLSAPTGVLGLGWSLSFEAVAAVRPGSAGTGSDRFVLLTAAGATPLIATGTAEDGTLSYAAEAYQFWQITRDPETERWEIVREDGVTWIYGEAAGGRGTVQWGVRWGSWIGSSSETAAQEPVATAWNLSRVVDLWGNEATFTYEQVSAPVGDESGLAYTQACYLGRIDGAAGDRAVFSYGEKEPEEYQDPHTDPPPPNAWQARYETRYLAAVTVEDADGVEQYRVSFDYLDENGATAYVGSGSFAKRLLTGVTRTWSGGDSLPGTDFTYHTESEPRGALRSVTLPEGGVFEYCYQEIDIGHSERALEIERPSVEGVSFASPRLWFAEGFTVVTWLGSDGNATVTAYAWCGRWLASTLGSLAVGDEEDYDALEVVIAGAGFGVVAGDAMLLYQRDVRMPGEWVAGPGVISLGLHAGEAAACAGGDGFVAVLGLESGALDRWFWTGSAWQQAEQLTLPGGGEDGLVCALAAARDFVFAPALLAEGDGDLSLTLAWLDALGEWHSEVFVESRPLATVQSLAATAGDTFAVLTASGPSGPYTTVDHRVFWWSPGFAALETAQLTRTATTAGSGETPAVHGSTIAVGEEVFRFDGAAWGRQSLAAITYPDEVAVTALSYGSDQVARTMVDANGSTRFDLVVYDPDESGSDSAWSAPGNLAWVAASGTGAATAVTARTAGAVSSYAVVGDTLCYQQPEADWEPVLTIPDTLDAEDAATLRLLAERYLIYQAGTDTVVYALANGTLADTGRITLGGQSIAVPGEDAGTLVGETAFVTYSGSWSSEQSVLTLHRVVSAAVEGLQKRWVAATQATDGGYGYVADGDVYEYGPTVTAYRFDAETATIDPSGTVAAFNAARSLPGSEWENNHDRCPEGTPEETQGESTVYLFNALARGETPAFPYPEDDAFTNAADNLALVAGRSYATEVAAQDGSVVSDSSLYWWVSTVALESGRQAFYVRSRRAGATLDRVPSRAETAYSAETGLPTEITTYQTNAEGEEEALSRSLVYFWEIYDPERTLNLLTPVVQATAATAAEVTAIGITTWKDDWGAPAARWAPWASYVATTATPEPFNLWSTEDESPASGWLRTGQVDARSRRGAVESATDVAGRRSSALLDPTSTLTIATFANASVAGDEAAYYGFEPYEENHWWSWLGGGSVADHTVAGEAHTGTRCLELPADPEAPAGPLATFRPAGQKRAYVFSSWVQSPEDFDDEAGDAGWSLTVYTAEGSPVGEEIVVPFPETGGDWVYLHRIVDLARIRDAAGINSAVELELTALATNRKQTLACRLDELRLSPLEGTYTAAVYQPDTRLVSATLGENGVTWRTVWDGFRRPVAGIGPDENVRGLCAPTLSRTVSPDGGFDPERPNSVLAATAASGGAYYDFEASQASDWSPSADGHMTDGWQMGDGRLAYDGEAAGPLGSRATLDGFARTNYAVRVTARRDTDAATAPANAGIGTGDVFTYWDEARQVWVLAGAGGAEIATREGVGFREDWLFGLVDNLAFFFADGIEVFSVELAEGTVQEGGLQLTLTGPGSFSQLALSVDPQVAVSFADGLGRPVQEMALVDGRSVVAGGTLYDALGRPLYGKNADSAEVALQDNYLDGAVGAYLPDSGSAGQPAASGSQETIDQYLAPSNGYPYTQTAYETSPLSRVVAQGAPGTAYSIAGGHPTTFAYGADTAGTCYLRTVVNPDGIATYSTVNQTGQLLERQVEVSAGVYNKITWSYDAAGNPTLTRLPNFFNPPAGSESQDWQIERTFSFLGQLTTETTPDTGTTRYAYDSAGRLRFVMDADGAAQEAVEDAQRILYTKYDALNRPTEEGYVQSSAVTWEDVKGYVDDEDWPGAEVEGAYWSRRYTWDDDGSTTAENLVGRLWRVEIDAGDPAAPDSETYRYDRAGNKLEVATVVRGDDEGETWVTDYAYNNLGQATEITYPRPASQEGDPFAVGLYYDRLGRLAGIGEPLQGDGVIDPDNPPTAPEVRYAAYAYNPDGSLAAEALNNEGSGEGQILRAYTYNTPGWPTAITDDFLTETLTYDQGGYDGAGYYNGQIASCAIAYGSAARRQASLSDYSYQYAYDPLGQLSVASCSLDAEDATWGLGPEPTAYDADGNFDTVRRGPSLQQYAYGAGNRVESVASSAAVTMGFEDGDDFAGWTWGSSNAGPSASGIVDEGTGDGNVFELAGGSFGHYEWLQYRGFLDTRGTYTLSYRLKSAEGFDSGAGGAGWYLRLFAGSRPLVDLRLEDLSAGSSSWQERSVEVDTAAAAQDLGLGIEVTSVALVLINGKRSAAGSAGAALYVDDVAITGGAESGDYGYDADGNVTAAPARQLDSIGYDPVSGLPVSLKIDGPRAQDLTWTYGAAWQRTLLTQTASAGSRISKALSLFGGGGRPLAIKTERGGEETEPDSEKTTVYCLYGPTGLLATVTDGVLRYALRDHLGSTRMVVDQDRRLSASYDYGPFGELLRSTGGRTASSPDVDPGLGAALFTGQPSVAPAGLYGFPARLYDPALRRFYEADTAGQYASPYCYVGNDPINLFDPNGESAIPAIALAGSAAVGGAINLWNNWNDAEDWRQGASYFLAGATAGFFGAGALIGFGVAGATVGSAVLVGGFVGGATLGAVAGVSLNAVNNAIRDGSLENIGQGAGEAAGYDALIGSILGGLVAALGNAYGASYVLHRDRVNSQGGRVTPIGRRDRYEWRNWTRYFFEPSGRYILGNDLTQGMRSMGLLAEVFGSVIMLRNRALPPAFLGFERRGFDLDHVVVQRWFRNTPLAYVFNAAFNLFPVTSWFNQQFLEANVATWTGQTYPPSQLARRFLVRFLWIMINASARMGGLAAIAYLIYDHQAADD